MSPTLNSCFDKLIASNEPNGSFMSPDDRKYSDEIAIRVRGLRDTVRSTLGPEILDTEISSSMGPDIGTPISNLLGEFGYRRQTPIGVTIKQLKELLQKNVLLTQDLSE